MKVKKLLLTISMILVMLMIAVSAYASCTTIPVGKDASVDGSVMTSHTVDEYYEFRLTIVLGKTYPSGAMRDVYKGGGLGAERPQEYKVGEIPQVEKTYTYFSTSYPFMNEHQLIIGETTLWHSPAELINQDGWFDIMDLQRIILERCKTAREAIKLIGSLVEEYGYGDMGECLTIGDPNEIWQLEILGIGILEKGAVWAAQRIPDDHVGVSANRGRIGEINLDDPDNFMASKNVFLFAQETGRWDPKEGPFVFYKAYDPTENYYNALREWRVLSLLAPSLKLDPKTIRYPFSVKPDKKVSVKDIMAIKRDYYEGTEFDLTKGMAAGPFGCPNRYATSDKLAPEGSSGWERALSMYRCAYSQVSQARSWLPDSIGGVAWFGLDAPHSTCYIPLYSSITKLPASFGIGRRDVFDRNSAWWAFDFVSNWADLKFSYMIEDIKAAQNELEGGFFAMQPAIEQAALEMYKTDPALAIKFLTDYSNSCANKTVDTWWELADKLIVKYNDGFINIYPEVSRKSPGYPEWWLKEVGYGLKTIVK